MNVAAMMTDFTRDVQPGNFFAVSRYDESPSACFRCRDNDDGGIDISLGLAPDLLGPEEETVPFNERMIPHWKSFARFVQDNCNKLNHLQINGLQMHRDVLNILAPALRTTQQLIYLGLEKNNLGGDGLFFVSQFLRENTTLSGLHLEMHQFDDLDAVRSFSSAVKKHPRLETLSLQNCGVARDVDILSSIFDGVKRITRIINLRDNKMGSTCIATISDFISGNPAVKNLILCHNEFCDVDATSLADALKKNTNLTDLDLSFNRFSNEGMRQLEKAAFDTTNLNSIVESNHFCCLDTSFFTIESDMKIETNIADVNLTVEGVGAKIRYKLFGALCGTRGDGEVLHLHYFDDIPLELMHHILYHVMNPMYLCFGDDLGYFTRIDEQPKEKLDRVFCILQKWKMPLLFANRSSSSNSKRAGRIKRKRNVAT